MLTLRLILVAVFVMTMRALAMTRPLVSTTVPEIVAPVTWASRVRWVAHATIVNIRKLAAIVFRFEAVIIETPPVSGQSLTQR